MFDHRLTRLVCGVIVGALVLGAPFAPEAPAQSKKLKIGVVYDYTGPFAGGGSELPRLSQVSEERHARRTRACAARRTGPPGWAR